jgi:S1-C subfamily serine protease
LQPFQAPVQQNIDYIANAAVTIETGRGHGSGFFLTPDGWIMTNAYVARGNSTVKVVLADGRSVFAQVARMHDARDVALIKADGAGCPPCPCAFTPCA